MKEPESPYLTISEGEGGNFLQDYYNNFDVYFNVKEAGENSCKICIVF